jgi:biotin synthase
MLSRVTWPLFSVEDVLNRIKIVGSGNLVKRICIQTMNYRDVFKEVLALSNKINSVSGLPISISCQPLNKEQIQQLMNTGVDRIGISLDAATKELFKKNKGTLVEGPYVWEKHIEGLKNAVHILGRGHVTTHFIVGLGETDRELIEIIQRMVNMGVHPSLFAFTPIPGTNQEKRPQPSIRRYRRIQLAHYLITNGKAKCEDIVFNLDGNIMDFRLEESLISDIVKTGLPFMTSGCPGCNRPYYNEKPGGPLYNYPFNPVLTQFDK